jgi:N12 class adenine-specific DNA methylase
MIRVRDAVRRCLRSPTQRHPGRGRVTARQQLNQTYDRFVARFGPISERGQHLRLSRRPRFAVAAVAGALRRGNRPATKAAIFRERTIQKQAARSAGSRHTPPEALLVTLNERGCVDLDYLAGLLHRKPNEFLPDLKGAIFLNPQTNRWETEDEYLSGNVRAKLAAAEAAALAG